MSQSPELFKPCVSCGAAQPGSFCASCGEKRVSAHDFSISHFAENAFETFTHFDSKALRTLRLLVTAPRFLTLAFLQGRRRAYVGPVQLFVIVNVLFALLIGFTHWVPFNTPLRIQETNPPFVEMKRARVEREIAHRGLTREEFTREFDSNARLQSKTWIFSIIPVYALLLAALYGWRRFLYEHLVFATYFFTFTVLVFFAFAFGFDYLVVPIAGWAAANLEGIPALLLLVVLHHPLDSTLMKRPQTASTERPDYFMKNS